MKVSDAGRKLIEQFEGCRLGAYLDVVGIPTIGYGHTAAVRMGQRITQAEADAMLSDDLDNKYGAHVEMMLQGAPTTQAQFDAMVSLAYNIGEGDWVKGRLDRVDAGGFEDSTVRKRHIAGDYEGAAAAFASWNKAGGQVLQPLVRRRAAEAALYLSASVPAVGVPVATPLPEDQVRDLLRQVQTALNAEGLLERRDGSRPGLVDGDPGDQTLKALAAWRIRHPR